MFAFTVRTIAGWAAAALFTLPLARAGDPAPIRVACAAYTFHTFSVYEAVEKTEQAGLHYIETFTNQKLSPTDPTKIYDLSDAQLEQLRQHLALHHVAIASCMLAVPKDPAKARAIFEKVRRFGATNLGTDSVESIDTIEPLAKEFGLNVAFHNHPNDPKHPDYHNSDPQFMAALLKGRDPHIGVCADTGHWATSGVVPIEGFKLLEGRINSVHLKERSAIGRRTPDEVYGLGVNRISDLLDDLRAHHFGGLIVIEYETNPRDNLADVKQCVQFLQTHLGTLGG